MIESGDVIYTITNATMGISKCKLKDDIWINKITHCIVEWQIIAKIIQAINENL